MPGSYLSRMKDNCIKSPLYTALRQREPAFAVMSRLAAVGGTSIVEFEQNVELSFAEVLKALQKLNRLAEPRHGPQAVFPLLYDRLTHDYKDDPDFTPFRKLLGEHLKVSWPMWTGC